LSSVDDAGVHAALLRSLQACSEVTRGLSDEVSRHLFSHVDSPERSVWQ
jgi:hypothetical protein